MRSRRSRADSDGSARGASVGREVMTGAIAAAVVETAAASSVNEEKGQLVVFGTAEVGLIEDHTGASGWMWLLVLYVIFSLTRDLWRIVQRCLRRRKSVKPDPRPEDEKVVIWSTKFGNKLHFTKDCSWIENTKRTYGHEICAGCLRDLEKFWCSHCSSTHEKACEIRRRYL